MVKGEKEGREKRWRWKKNITWVSWRERKRGRISKERKERENAVKGLREKKW